MNLIPTLLLLISVGLIIAHFGIVIGAVVMFMWLATMMMLTDVAVRIFRREAIEFRKSLGVIAIVHQMSPNEDDDSDDSPPEGTEDVSTKR